MSDRPTKYKISYAFQSFHLPVKWLEKIENWVAPVGGMLADWGNFPTANCPKTII